MKFYVLINKKGEIAVKSTDNKLGIFVRRDLAEKNMWRYGEVKIVEVEVPDEFTDSE